MSGLKAGTDYFYRVIATNSSGQSQSATQTFQTLPTPAVLPDGRSWELVSPAEKGGGSVEPIALDGGLIQAAAERRRRRLHRKRPVRRADRRKPGA